MLSLLALALAASPILPRDDRPLILHGECIYPPAVGEKVPDAVQMACDSVEVSTSGVDFRQGEWNAHSRFFGSWKGSVLTVTSFQPRNARRAEAHGQCRIDHTNGAISIVSCTAFSNGRGWLANFRNVPH